MMAFDLRVKRWKNQWAEFQRLNGFMFTRQHLGVSWRIASPESWPVRTIRTTNGSLLKNPDGSYLEYKRDSNDQIITFIGDYLRTYWHNIFVVSRCTHPHEKVFEEWEGDKGIGYYRYLYCSRCYGYPGDEDVDRYLPESERSPKDYIAGFKPLRNY